MKILFAIDKDAIQEVLIAMLQNEAIPLDYNPERDSVQTKDLIVEKIKYNISGQESDKYDIAIINEKLEGEYDLIEIVRFLIRNKIRPIILLGNRSDNDPLIHALIKRKVYDFMYGKLNLADIFQSIVTPRRYEDVEHLVDLDVEEYKATGKSISGFFDSGSKHKEDEEDIIDIESNIDTTPKGSAMRTPGLGMKEQKHAPTLNFPGIKDIKDVITTKANNIIQPTRPTGGNGRPESVVVQQNFVAQLPLDYKKNIVVYSNQQVGKSFIACNLATIFAARGKKTCLVDLDFKNKSQYYYFDMSKYEKRVNNISDMNIIAKVFETDVEDASDIYSNMFTPMKNLYVITSHPDLEVLDYDIDALYRVYVMLKNMFDVVIYDLPHDCPEDFLQLLMTQVEEIMIVTNQNCSILDRTEKDLRDVLTGYFVNNKVSLIINQYIDHREMSKGNIKDHLSVIETRAKDIEFNFRNVFTIPNNYPALVESIAKGKPAVIFDEELRVIFENIASKYYPDVNPKRRG